MADAWHDSGVGVKRGGVFLVAECAKKTALGLIGRSQHGEGLIGMGGDDDAVELSHRSILDAHGGGGFGFAHFHRFGRELDRLQMC